MAPSELRRKLVFLFTVILIVTLVLLILPFVEAWIKDIFYSSFNLQYKAQKLQHLAGLNQDGEKVWETAGQLAQTLHGLILNVFRIV